jgi:hypothetical protein
VSEFNFFLGTSDEGLVADIAYAEYGFNRTDVTDEERQYYVDRIAAAKAEQERRSLLPQVWVVTTVWSATDESDTFGDYPLSSLALFEKEDDAKKFAMAELAHHDLGREKASEEDPDWPEGDDDDVAPIGLPREGRGLRRQVLSPTLTRHRLARHMKSAGVYYCTAHDGVANEDQDECDFAEGMSYEALECVEHGTHLTDCDDDGFCNTCGQQEKPCVFHECFYDPDKPVRLIDMETT